MQGVQQARRVRIPAFVHRVAAILFTRVHTQMAQNHSFQRFLPNIILAALAFMSHLPADARSRQVPSVLSPFVPSCDKGAGAAPGSWRDSNLEASTIFTCEDSVCMGEVWDNPTAFAFGKRHHCPELAPRAAEHAAGQRTVALEHTVSRCSNAQQWN